MSKIEWTEKTWNPITGCTKVSPGCAHCYAENVANRFWGDRKFGDVQFHEDRLRQPLRRKKPTMYFVNSMSDLFHESVTDEQLDRIFAVMALTPQHTYQVLTKRPKRMLEYCNTIKLPLPNLWLGVSVETQRTADERIPLLLQTPAAVRFLSCEPLLGKVHLNCLHWQDMTNIDCLAGKHGIYFGGDCNRVDWVIVGGESGSKARPCDVDWIRSIIEQCRVANVPCFVKQLGSHSSKGKGNNIDKFPKDLRVRKYPEIKE